MKYITRRQWGARAPQRRYSSISNVRGIAIHWNGPGMRIGAHENCDRRVKSIQSFHMGSTRNWNDIAYSWLVCPHGVVYEGRGWGNRTAANGTNEGNSYYHAVMFLGGKGDPFSDDAKRGLRKVILESKRRYGSQVRPHSYFKDTECPGDEIRDWIRADYPASGAVEPSPEPEPIDPWKEFWDMLTDKEKDLAKEFFGYLAGADGVEKGDSFARQFLIFNRVERGRLREFLDAIDEMDSSPNGQGRALSALWREAGARNWDRDIDKFKENRHYSEDELTNK